MHRQLEWTWRGIAGTTTDLLHLGIDGTGVDGEDVDVVGVGLDDLFSDRSRIEDHGELQWASTNSFESALGQTQRDHVTSHLGSAVQLDRSQLRVVQLLHRSKMNIRSSHSLPTIQKNKDQPD